MNDTIMTSNVHDRVTLGKAFHVDWLDVCGNSLQQQLARVVEHVSGEVGACKSET